MPRSKRIGMRVLRIVLGIVCVIGLVQPAAAVDINESKTVYTTLVRYRADLSAPVIGQMENKTVVTVLAQCGEFYEVDCYDGVGYIAKSQVFKNRQGVYTIRCQVTSGETRKLECVTLQDALKSRLSILSLSRQQLGTAYVYGGKAPGGFDCSGLIYYVYGNHDYDLHRCADEQLQDGIIVSKDCLQPGDLIFYKDPALPWLASHVAIYVGNNQILHASSKGVGYSDMDNPYYASRYLCARRLVNVRSDAISWLPETVSTASAAASRNFTSRSTGIRTLP